MGTQIDPDQKAGSRNENYTMLVSLEVTVSDDANKKT